MNSVSLYGYQAMGYFIRVIDNSRHRLWKNSIWWKRNKIIMFDVSSHPNKLGHSYTYRSQILLLAFVPWLIFPWYQLGWVREGPPINLQGLLVWYTCRYYSK